jgi:hypothetical protein
LARSRSRASCWDCLRSRSRRFHYLSGPAGSGANNAGVEIHFVVRHGQAKRIKLFGWFNVPATCSPTGTTAVTGKLHHIKVASSGKFSITKKVNSGATTYTVTGKFKGLKKAKGTLRIQGPVPGCGSADTGTLHWTATHH